ncbi:cholinephosphate cytidylyltransferase [Crassisporium funariophilum]|nr:cholinephosphate cytidylyltransferase [Crassisporium funariophilum]
MDSSGVLSDDDYDVISNPGQRSLESSVEDFEHDSFSAVRELPASEEAKDTFETTRWTASDIQAYFRKQLEPRYSNSNQGRPVSFSNKIVRVYVDGSFDTFDVAHVLQLRQAKLAFPHVQLVVGVFSDHLLETNGCNFAWPEVERLEVARHCRWVDEVTKDAPWELTLQFLRDKRIDFVAIDEGTSVDPNCDKARVKGYDELMMHGKVIKTRRTQRKITVAIPSRRATPTMAETPVAPDLATHADAYGIGY